MNHQNEADKYFMAVHDTDRESAQKLVKDMLDKQVLPEDIVFHVIVPSIDKMIEAFLDDKIILTQHYISTRISEELIEMLIPKFPKKPGYDTTVVIGSARGDFHGLGKKIVIGVLKANMIKVIDLGLNVSAEQFVETAIKENANIIGISSMMVHTAIGDHGPKKVRELLKEQGLEKQIKLIVGGAPYRFDDDLYLEAGADAWAGNGLEALKKIKELVKTEKHVK